MCDTCGCNDPNSKYKIIKPEDSGIKNQSHDHEHSSHEHKHGNEHDHNHSHAHSHDHSKKIEIEQDVLYKNNLLLSIVSNHL